MKSLRLRLGIWFGVSFLTFALVFLGFSYKWLEEELHHKSWEKDYPNHPDWKIHGSFSKEEIQDIMQELAGSALLYGIPLAALTFLVGWWLARRSLEPIASVNRQLKAVSHRNLAQPILLEEIDDEFRDLVANLNDLLSRLHGSFTEMSEYAAKVAHELRTPLAILRLKMENASGALPPDLTEELQAELHRLTHVVDQSLLIAKAEQRRLVLTPEVFNLGLVVGEIVEDFQLLARDQNRDVVSETVGDSMVRADPKYLRQIVHNLMANSLKYGAGSWRVRVKGHGRSVRLTIANRVAHRPQTSDQTLGLGLRVVKTLIQLQPEVTYTARQRARYYAVQLRFPVVEAAGRESGSIVASAASSSASKSAREVLGAVGHHGLAVASQGPLGEK